MVNENQETFNIPPDSLPLQKKSNPIRHSSVVAWIGYILSSENGRLLLDYVLCHAIYNQLATAQVYWVRASAIILQYSYRQQVFESESPVEEITEIIAFQPIPLRWKLRTL